MSRRRMRPSYSRLTPLASTSAGPETQAGEERRGHAPPALVEELDHRRVRADRDDQRRARLVGEQERRVLAHALGDELVVLDAGREQVLAAGRAPVGMHVVDQLRAAVHRVVGERVEVADDDVGLQLHREQRVGAAVDRDQHRLVLAHVGPQRLEIVLVVVAAHDDEHVPAAGSSRAAAGAAAARR